MGRGYRLTKKKIASLAMVIALFAIAAAGTLAYYTDEAVAHNVITTGAVDITLNDKTLRSGVLVDFPEGGIGNVLPAVTVSKVVSVTNERADAWVRIRLEHAIEAADGSPLPLELAGGIPAYSLNLIEGTPWVRGTDGHWYYSEPVGTGETTDVLFDGVHFAPQLDNAYQGSTVHINVIAEAVQYANNTEVPNSDFSQIPGWPEG